MAASREDISSWFDRGVAQGSSHMIVICDTYDWEDYPMYVSPGQDAADIAAKNNGVNMQRVMEVYNLSMDKAVQLNTHRVWNV